jgi:hypothetical protein
MAVAADAGHRSTVAVVGAGPQLMAVVEDAGHLLMAVAAVGRLFQRL